MNSSDSGTNAAQHQADARLASDHSGLGKEPLRFSDEQFIWRFSPNRTDPELLEGIFVGREPLLENVLEKIDDAATSGSTHHVLLYGPRGIGKSHFVAMLHHRLLSDEKLNATVQIAHLNEDETTTSMVQLLVRIYRSLCKAYPDAYSVQWLDELLNQTADEVTGVLSRRLVARFEGRTLVILVENLDQLFQNLGTSGQHELRTFLQEHPFASVFATSQQLFKAVADRSQPFFGFFQQIPLQPLSLTDAQQLLSEIARGKGQNDLAEFLDTPEGRGRVRAIHDLAGGNHRVYIVLTGFVTRESLDQLVVPFQKMADALTPYYQERLRGISPLQRQIVEVLCRQHGTLNPKEIARRLLVDQRTVGKQVRMLVESGYLSATKRGRETFYELTEVLMRLAYEVKERSLLEPLIEFLRNWYRPNQKQSLRLRLSQDQLGEAASGGYCRDLAILWEDRARASNLALDWLTAGYCYYETNDPENAIACYDNVLVSEPAKADAGWLRSEACFALHRWDEGFDTIRDAFSHSSSNGQHGGDVAAMLGLIFRLSEDDTRLQSRINSLVNVYQQAAEELAFGRSGHAALRRSSDSVQSHGQRPLDERGSPRHSARSKINPLLHFACGLINSLSKIDADHASEKRLEGYVAAVEKRLDGMPEFEISLRLFRYGIRYLISRKESEFVELIQPERSILRQAVELGDC